VSKVQSASLYFFLGSEEDEEESEDEEDEVCLGPCAAIRTKRPARKVDVKALQHRREINKKTRSGDKKMRKQLKEAKNVGEKRLSPIPC